MSPSAVDYTTFRLYWPAYSMCKRCHCTEEDCSQCIERTGMPCWWVTPYLCSACYVQALMAQAGQPIGQFDGYDGVLTDELADVATDEHALTDSAGASEASQDFIRRPAGLFVSELPADEWQEMHDIIAMMEGDERADFVMQQVVKLPAA